MAEFMFEGRSIRVIPQHEIDLGDLDFIKEHFGIAGLVALEEQMAEMDPTAWRAILVASVRRVDPNVSPKHDGVSGVAILPLILALNQERAERLEEIEAQKAGGARPTRAGTRGRSGDRK